MDKKYTAEGVEIFLQCCVCRLPAAPAGLPQNALSHGYHSQCFRSHHADDYSEEEMAEEMELFKPSIPGDKLL